MQHIILASQSPRRKMLLEWAEQPFAVMVPTTDESYPAGMALSEVPVHIAREKAFDIHKKLMAEGVEMPRQPILAADTIVLLHQQVIGKPKDRQDAINILTALSGQEHQVLTGVIILHAGGEIAFTDVTDVVFHPLTYEQICFYVDTYQPYDKAGAYAIQEWIGVVGIRSVSGDFYNVMGLPVSRVVQALQTLIPQP